MSIRTRIGVALGAVLLLHIFTAVMGHVGLERAQADSVTLEQVNADTLRLLALDREVTELQRSVTRFMLTGHDSAAERVREMRDRVQTQIETALRATIRPDTRVQLEQMALRIQAYGENFEKVAIDRANRERLVRDEMFSLRDRVLEQLPQEGSDDAVATTRYRLVRAEAAALRYFDDPARLWVRETVSLLRGASAAAVGLEISHDNAPITELIAAYERAFLEAVQATQGYLHLVNVVLAGEASELLHQSEDIRVSSLMRRQELRQAMQADSRRFQLLSDLVAVATVLAGVVMASLMTRSVLRPILSVTETLRRLARGESDAEIEGVERVDEIGAMSKAAEVFRLKNIETERLLVESRRLGVDLERRNSEMTQFVYTVSHDLKSPLVSIQGFIGKMRRLVEKGEFEDVERVAGRVDGAAKRMTRTLEDLLELSRIGVVVQSMTDVNVNEMCDIVLADLELEIANANAEVRIAEGLPPMRADDLRLRQVIQNLIQNALKHGAPAHGQHVVEVDATEAEGEVVLCVRDNGPGVAPEHAEKIFGIFQRLDASAPGTGVGLAIVKKIADAHDGRVWVEPAPGGGAAFYFAIPSPNAQSQHAA